MSQIKKGGVIESMVISCMIYQETRLGYLVRTALMAWDVLTCFT